MAEMQSNRNDDIFGRTDKEFGAPSIDSLALKYSKAQLQQMAQMGRIPPIYAVMAGMAQDRIQLNNSQAPKTTVAQDTLSQGVADSSGQGITDSSGAAVGAGERVAPQSAADISKAYGGLMSIPRPGEKYDQSNFATGGIVAFDEGGRVKKEYLTRDPIDAELAEFQAEAEQARGANTRPMFEPQAYRPNRKYSQNQGPSGGLPQIMGSPEVPTVAAPTSTVDVETQKQLAKVQPAAAPAGPLAAMVQKAAPASDEFAQQGADLMKLPTRTPTNTTGLIDTPEEIAKDREDILNSTIGYAGAEIMAGKSQFAMTNIGEGLSKAFASYAQRIGEHKKLRKSDIKDFATITQADEALKSGDVKAALNAWTHLNDTKERAKVEREKMVSEEKQAGIRARASTTPFEAWLSGTPEQRAEIEKFASIGKDKRDFGPEQGLKLEELWVEERSLPKYRNLSDAQLAVAKQNWIATIPGMGGGGGGGGKGEVNKSNPLLTGK